MWIKSDRHFSARLVNFTISHYEEVTRGLTLPEALAEQPKILEVFLLELIKQARPELEGCVLWAMNVDSSTLCWKLLVSHGSLPPDRGPGGMIHEEPLFRMAPVEKPK